MGLAAITPTHLGKALEEAGEEEDDEAQHGSGGSGSGGRSSSRLMRGARMSEKAGPHATSPLHLAICRFRYIASRAERSRLAHNSVWAFHSGDIPKLAYSMFAHSVPVCLYTLVASSSLEPCISKVILRLTLLTFSAQLESRFVPEIAPNLPTPLGQVTRVKP